MSHWGLQKGSHTHVAAGGRKFRREEEEDGSDNNVYNGNLS